MRTQEEKDHMVRALKHERTTLPERSKFGTPNHAIIDAQIAIVEGRSEPDDFDGDDDIGDEETHTLTLCDAWLDGNEGDTPASAESLEATKTVTTNG